MPQDTSRPTCETCPFYNPLFLGNVPSGKGCCRAQPPMPMFNERRELTSFPPLVTPDMTCGLHPEVSGQWPITSFNPSVTVAEADEKPPTDTAKK